LTSRPTGLAAFAEVHPEYARLLAGRGSGVGFPAGFLEKMDRAIRVPTPSRPLLRLVLAFARLRNASCWDFFLDSLLAEASASTERRRCAHALRSIWGTTPIVNVVACAAADRLLGVQAETVVLATYHTTHRFDVNLAEQEKWALAQAPQLWPSYRWLLFAWALLSYDIFFYFNDRGLLPPGGYGHPQLGINAEEMRLIRVAGKALFTLAYGADYRSRARTYRAGSYSLCMACPEIGKYCLCDEAAASKILAKISAHANAVLGAGLSMEQLPNPVQMDFLVIDVGRFRPVYPRRSAGKPLRVVHAPNHPFFKGTQYLQEAVQFLQASGVPIELILIQGQSNDEALRAFSAADVVADQFISGSFGYTAIEAMALGKPVLCFIRDDAVLPDRKHLPIIGTSPDGLVETLRRLAVSRGDLPRIGHRSRQYVEQNYSLESFALRLHKLYQSASGFGDSVPRPAGVLQAHHRRLRVIRATRFATALARTAHAVLLRYPRRLTARLWHVPALVQKLFVVARHPAALRYASRKRALQAAKWLLLRATRRPLPLPIRAGRMLTALRLWTGRPRTLWGITPILTLPLLTRCDRLLGLRSASMVFTTYYTFTNFDINFKRIHIWLLRDHPGHYENFCRLILAWALLRYDIFHFFCDRGILPSRHPIGIKEAELDALRSSGKRLYTYTYGADVRTRQKTLSLGEYNLCRNCPEPGRFCICNDESGKANVDAIAQRATRMVSMGDMLSYVPNAVNLHYWPIDTRAMSAGPNAVPPGEVLRVAHAPNHPHFKGTEFLEDAVARLQKEGVPIELVRIQGVPNHKVLELFQSVHVVADQFIAGFHGYTALEAMALGKAVLCFLRDPDMVMEGTDCPIIRTTPASIYKVLKGCALGAYDLRAIGERSRLYVERHHSIEAVASRLGDLYLTSAKLPLPSASRVRRGIRRSESLLK